MAFVAQILADDDGGRSPGADADDDRGFRSPGVDASGLDDPENKCKGLRGLKLMRELTSDGGLRSPGC